MLALLCRGAERTVRARGAPIALVLWEGARGTRDKKLWKTRVGTKRRVIVWWEITARNVVATEVLGQQGCCGGEEQPQQYGKRVLCG